MSLKNKDQEITVFIDVQNLYHSAKNIYQARVNFKEVLKTAVASRKLIRAFAYVVRTKTGEEKPFFEALLKLGIETRTKDLQEYYGGLKKADWDVGIAMDMIKMSDLVDVIVLVSGDGDYVPVVEYLQNHGRLVEAVGFREGTSSKLFERVDDFLDLSQDLGRFLIRKRVNRRGSSQQKAEAGQHNE